MCLSLTTTSSFSSLITLILSRLASSCLCSYLSSSGPLSMSLSLSSFSSLITLILPRLDSYSLFSPFFPPCLSASVSYLASLQWSLSFSPDLPHPAFSYLSFSTLLFMSLSLSITSSFSFIDYPHSHQTGLVPLLLTFLPLVFSPCLPASLSHLLSLHWLLSFSQGWPHPACSNLSSSSLLSMSLSLSIPSSFSSLITLILPRLASSRLFLPFFSPFFSATLSHLPSLHWSLSFLPDWPHTASSYLSFSSFLSMSPSLSITSSFSLLITFILPRLASSRLFLPFFL